MKVLCVIQLRGSQYPCGVSRGKSDGAQVGLSACVSGDQFLSEHGKYPASPALRQGPKSYLRTFCMRETATEGVDVNRGCECSTTSRHNQKHN